MYRRSRTTLLACALLGTFGCGAGPDNTAALGGSMEERSPLNCSEDWDPVWSQGAGANEWWVEFVIEDENATSAHLEVIGLGVVDLTYEWGKWSGSPSFAVSRGASVILHATNALGQSAQTRVFGYLVDTLPVTDCVGEGGCVPSCGDRECGGDGCGGTCGSCGGGEQCQAGFCESFPDEGGTFQESRWITGLTSPTTAAFTPDGRLLVAERFGRLRVVKNGTLLSTPFLTVPVTTQGERGLIGVAIDPDFENNGHVYVYYSYTGGDQRGLSRISRFTASTSNPDVAAAGSERILINDIPNYIWHNAGALHFGHDGMLYFAVGDNNDRPSAQSLGAITGKIGRIDPSRYPNIIPPDNPFVGVPGAREEVWALGFRNPFTFAVDPESDRIYVNDVGDADWEEVNALRKGANYGWARCEGEHLLTSSQPCNDAALTNPLFAYPHEDRGGLFGCSVIGGAFYRGSQFPAQYRGDYFFVDYCERWIARLTEDGQVIPFFEPSWSLITTLLEGPDGALYYVNNGTGEIWKLEYVGGNGNRAPVARVSATPTSGTAPLTVSFDGRGSSDPDGDALSYTWSFGDGGSGSGATTSHAYASAGRYTARLSVSDGSGGFDSATVTIDVGSGGGGSSQVAIVEPSASDTYDAGESYTYRGTAVNALGQPLPASAYSWTIWFHHDEHRHPFLGPIEGVTSGTLTIPTVGEISANVWYRIHLTVTEGGSTREVIRDFHPNTATITLRTDPAELTLLLDEGTVDGTQSVESVTGVVRQLEAPSPQQIGGRWYEFASWSDGGAQAHAISTPASDTTYTARYREVGQPSEEADAVLYDDALHWSDWSWGTSVNASATSPAQGARSLAVTYSTAWAGLSLQRDAFDTGAYEALRFAVHPGGRPLPAVVAWFHLQGGASSSDADIRDYATAIGGGWYQVDIPLADLGVNDTTVTRLNLQDLSGGAQPTFHVDDIRLSAGTSAPPPPPPPPPPAASALVYDDGLAWEDWSWGVTLGEVSSPTYDGARALALTYTTAWAGLSLHHDGFDTAPYTHLVMALRPSGGSLPRLVTSLYDPGDEILAEVEVRPWSTALAGGWFLVEIPLEELGAAGATVTRVQLQDGTGGPVPTLHVDTLGFVAK